MTTAKLRARLEELQLPVPETVQEYPDRIKFQPSVEFNLRLAELIKAGTFNIWPESVTKCFHGPTALWSYRECRAWNSLQITFHTTGEREVDCDFANPDWGALPASVHGVMVGASWLTRGFKWCVSKCKEA